jgi:hypothetical protein
MKFRSVAFELLLGENNTETGIRHNVTITRLYKEGNDWKDSTSFGRDDLPLLAKVTDLAHTRIFSRMPEKNRSSQNGNGHGEFAEERARF